jgi:hypothetical protein
LYSGHEASACEISIARVPRILGLAMHVKPFQGGDYELSDSAEDAKSKFYIAEKLPAISEC